jgi:hypothetical protein
MPKSGKRCPLIHVLHPLGVTDRVFHAVRDCERFAASWVG